MTGICSLLALSSALEAKESGVSNPLPDQFWVKFDEYSRISPKTERFRLKNFAIQLQGWKTSKAFIVAHAGRRSCKAEAQARANRVKEYLIQSGGIEASRISTIDAGYQEKWTIELFLAPREAPPLTLAIIKEAHPGLSADQVQVVDCKREFTKRL